MFNILFKIEHGTDVKAKAEAGKNLLELMRELNIDIDVPCSGNGTCGKCKVHLIGGSLESSDNKRLTDEEFKDGVRLACQSRINSDAVIFVPASAAAFKKDIKTADLSSPKELKVYQDSMDRIFNAGINTGVSNDSNLINDTSVGIAIDIGTTTVTMAMIDLASKEILAKASLGNGQIRYGADVINRIICQSKENGVEKLKRAIREETIIPMVEAMLKQSGKSASDISRYVIAGNTTMEHLFLGADGQSIRLEPYVPEFLERTGDTAESTGLPGKKEAPVIFAPNVGSYVGGDITAGVLDTLLWNDSEMSLFIDLGTNGELVFGNSDFMLTCACSAGPAFEGGDISCGMRATTGSIDSVKLDEKYEPHYSIIGAGSDGSGGIGKEIFGHDEMISMAIKPLGFCGSGLISVISELFRTGAINAKGKFIGEGCHINENGMYDSKSRIRYDEYGGGFYVAAFAEESGSGKEITLTESDLDNFIRAKGAIFSAIRTMLKSLDMTVDCIDKVIIAGGIGSGIDMEKAISIGMLPKVSLEKYSYIGNSSLTGACAMLLSDEAVDKVFELGRNMTYLELSTEPGYMDELIAACFIPHTDSRLFD